MSEQATATPGPWTVEHRGPGLLYVWFGPPETGSRRAIVVDGSDHLVDDEDLANARRQAAAPPLLAACEAALQLLTDLESDGPVSEQLVAAICAAHGEIAP